MWIAAWEKINLPHRKEEMLVQTAGQWLCSSFIIAVPLLTLIHAQLR
jgi:hypothetical protein